MDSLGAAMDRGRGDGSGTTKRRPAARRLLPCWLPRPIPKGASCSAELTGGNVLPLHTLETLIESILNLKYTGNHRINGSLAEIDAMSIALLS